VPDAGEGLLKPQLLGSLYEAVLDLEIWPAVLERTGAALGGEAALMGWFDLEAGALVAEWSSNLDAATLELLRGRHLHNPWIDGALALTECEVFRTEELIGPAELRRTAFFDELLNPLGLHHGLGCLLLREGERAGLFLALRSKRAGPFELEATALCRLLAPHLSRAFELTLQTLAARAERAAALRTLDFIQLGIVLLDSSGRVYHVNAAARRLCDEADGLSIDAGALRAAERDEHEELTRRVRQVAASCARPGRGRSGVLTLTRPSMRRALEVLVAPLQGSTVALSPGTPAVVVFVSDPELPHEGYEGILRRLYGLTEAEARLALFVIQGVGIAAAARTLGIGLSTARSQAQKVFQKTGTRGQTELVSLLLRGALQVNAL